MGKKIESNEVYLTTINILGRDFKVYGMNEKEYDESKETLQGTWGTTNVRKNGIRIVSTFWALEDKKEFSLDWRRIENTIIHEIGHVIHEFGGYGNLREEEKFSHHSELTWTYGKKYIPIIKEIWLSKKEISTKKWEE